MNEKRVAVLGASGAALVAASALAMAGYHVHTGSLARPALKPPQDHDSERIAAAEAKRARKNAKRARLLKPAPTTGEG